MGQPWLPIVGLRFKYIPISSSNRKLCAHTGRDPSGEGTMDAAAQVGFYVR